MTLAHQKTHLGQTFILIQLPRTRRTLFKTVAPGEKDRTTLHTQGVGDLGPPGSKGRRQHIPYRDTINRSIPGTWQQIPHHTHIFKVEHFYRKLLGTVYLRAFIFPT